MSWHKQFRSLMRRFHRNEQGANQFVVLSACFILIWLTPIFVDFANLHFARRVSQSAADAAALAAATEYAKTQYLSVYEHWGDCVSSGAERNEVEKYLRDRVHRYLYSSIGYGPASSFASDQRAKILTYHPYPSHDDSKNYYKAGVLIQPIAIYVKVDRPTDLIYQNWYGGHPRTPAEATGEVYVGKVVNELTVACRWDEEGNPIAWKHRAGYLWRVRLIDTIY